MHLARGTDVNCRGCGNPIPLGTLDGAIGSERAGDNQPLAGTSDRPVITNPRAASSRAPAAEAGHDEQTRQVRITPDHVASAAGITIDVAGSTAPAPAGPSLRDRMRDMERRRASGDLDDLEIDVKTDRAAARSMPPASAVGGVLETAPAKPPAQPPAPSASDMLAFGNLIKDRRGETPAAPAPRQAPQPPAPASAAKPETASAVPLELDLDPQRQRRPAPGSATAPAGSVRPASRPGDNAPARPGDRSPAAAGGGLLEVFGDGNQTLALVIGAGAIVLALLSWLAYEAFRTKDVPVTTARTEAEALKDLLNVDGLVQPQARGGGGFAPAPVAAKVEVNAETRGGGQRGGREMGPRNPLADTSGFRVEPDRPVRDDDGEELATAGAFEEKNSADRANDYVRKGLAAFKQGDHPAALKAFRRALIEDQSNAVAHHGLGMCYATQGKNAEAINELEAFLRLAPSHREAPHVRQLINKLRRTRTF